MFCPGNLHLSTLEQPSVSMGQGSRTTEVTPAISMGRAPPSLFTGWWVGTAFSWIPDRGHASAKGHIMSQGWHTVESISGCRGSCRMNGRHTVSRLRGCFGHRREAMKRWSGTLNPARIGSRGRISWQADPGCLPGTQGECSAFESSCGFPPVISGCLAYL